MAIFLKLGDIEGDVPSDEDSKHGGWIKCDSFVNGSSRFIFVDVGAHQRDTNDPEFREVGLRMRMHKGSPKVFMASVVGKPVKAQIHITRTGHTGLENYLEVTLTDTYVTHYSMECNDDTPEEMISLNYAEIEQNYIPNNHDGTPGSKVPVGFSMKTGKKK
jgi:type VI secretion system secreted protein Hcp